MPSEGWAAGLTAFVLGLVVGTLVEYGAHRFMHAGYGHFGRKHAEHHRNGSGQGWVHEFAVYLLPSLSILWIGFLYSFSAGLGFAAGGTLHAAWAAYCHQLQHDRPELVFWMPRPVHHLHHEHRMWRHNFGISTDLWDRVFGTYRPANWTPGAGPRAVGFRDLLKIRWL